MPRSRWSDKDERMFEHVKESGEERGMKEERAEEMAARTVNKQRRVEGRTRNRRTMGTGDPRAPLEKRTKQELLNLARERKVKVTTRMRKEEIVDAIRGVN